MLTEFETADRLRSLFRDVLGLSADRAAALAPATALFGSMPELDSMAVASLLTEIEDRFGIIIDDEDLGGDMLETFGTLLAYVRSKVRA